MSTKSGIGILIGPFCPLFSPIPAFTSNCPDSVSFIRKSSVNVKSLSQPS